MSDEDLETFGDDSGFYSPFPISLEKLQTYIVPMINFRQILNGQTSYILEPMRRCTPEDFEKRGYVWKSEKDKKIAGYRFCPNFERMESLKVKNGYTNSKERYSYSVEIH